MDLTMVVVDGRLKDKDHAETKCMAGVLPSRISARAYAVIIIS